MVLLQIQIKYKYKCWYYKHKYKSRSKYKYDAVTASEYKVINSSLYDVFLNLSNNCLLFTGERRKWFSGVFQKFSFARRDKDKTPLLSIEINLVCSVNIKLIYKLPIVIRYHSDQTCPQKSKLFPGLGGNFLSLLLNQLVCVESPCLDFIRKKPLIALLKGLFHMEIELNLYQSNRLMWYKFPWFSLCGRT